MKEYNDLVYEIILNLKTVEQEIKARTHEHFKDMELTAPQGMLVFMLNKHGQLKITEISEHMGLSNSTVSGIVDRLEAQGFVRRIRSQKDRRVVNVEVTELTKEKLKCHGSVLEDIMTDALHESTSQELEVVASGIGMLSELLKRMKKEN